jgi:hypothetical protein
LARVVVDQRGPIAVLSHPCLEVCQARPALSGEGVAGVPKVVEMQPLSPRSASAWAQPDSRRKLPPRIF